MLGADVDELRARARHHHLPAALEKHPAKAAPSPDAVDVPPLPADAVFCRDVSVLRLTLIAALSPQFVLGTPRPVKAETMQTVLELPERKSRGNVLGRCFVIPEGASAAAELATASAVPDRYARGHGVWRIILSMSWYG